MTTPPPRRKRRAGVRSSSWIRTAKRWAIYERDGLLCVWCGERPDVFTLDHLFPRSSRWRDNHERRLVTACRTCNTSRKGRSVADHLRWIRDQGFDVAGVMRRLRIARFVPINRRAGERALAADRAALMAPLPGLPADFTQDANGVPF